MGASLPSLLGVPLVILLGLGFVAHKVNETAAAEVKQWALPLIGVAAMAAAGFVFVGWLQAGSYCEGLRDDGYGGSPSAEYFSEHCNVLMSLDP